MVLLQDCGVKAAPGRLPFQTQLTGQLHSGCLPANVAEACRTEQPASASLPQHGDSQSLPGRELDAHSTLRWFIIESCMLLVPSLAGAYICARRTLQICGDAAMSVLA